MWRGCTESWAAARLPALLGAALVQKIFIHIYPSLWTQELLGADWKIPLSGILRLQVPDCPAFYLKGDCFQKLSNKQETLPNFWN